MKNPCWREPLALRFGLLKLCCFSLVLRSAFLGASFEMFQFEKQQPCWIILYWSRFVRRRTLELSRFSGKDARQATAGWCSACSRTRAWVCDCGQEPPSSQPPPSPNYYHDDNNCGLWFRHRVILHWLGCDRFHWLLCGRPQYRISCRVYQLRQMFWVYQGQMAFCRPRQWLLYPCCSIQRWPSSPQSQRNFCDMWHFQHVSGNLQGQWKSRLYEAEVGGSGEQQVQNVVVRQLRNRQVCCPNLWKWRRRHQDCGLFKRRSCKFPRVQERSLQQHMSLE